MRKAIKNEAKLHPMAQPQDYIKLIFQSISLIETWRITRQHYFGVKCF